LKNALNGGDGGRDLGTKLGNKTVLSAGAAGPQKVHKKRALEKLALDKGLR